MVIVTSETGLPYWSITLPVILALTPISCADVFEAPPHNIHIVSNAK